MMTGGYSYVRKPPYHNRHRVQLSESLSLSTSMEIKPQNSSTSRIEISNLLFFDEVWQSWKNSKCLTAVQGGGPLSLESPPAMGSAVEGWAIRIQRRTIIPNGSKKHGMSRPFYGVLERQRNLADTLYIYKYTRCIFWIMYVHTALWIKRPCYTFI